MSCIAIALMMLGLLGMSYFSANTATTTTNTATSIDNDEVDIATSTSADNDDDVDVDNDDENDISPMFQDPNELVLSTIAITSTSTSTTTAVVRRTYTTTNGTMRNGHPISYQELSIHNCLKHTKKMV
jgi:cytoskeletal protein RodZ